MKYFLAILLAALAALPACQSSKSRAREINQVMQEAPDARPALYVSADDQRYVDGGTGREIHYYSGGQDRTYVVDENSGKVLKTFDSKTPSVVVVGKGAKCCDAGGGMEREPGMEHEAEKDCVSGQECDSMKAGKSMKAGESEEACGPGDDMQDGCGVPDEGCGSDG